MQPFEYVRAGSLGEALQAAAAPGAMVYAGGTTAFDLMKLEVMAPATLVDITRLQELRGIEETDDSIRFGALATMGEAQDHPTIRRDYPLIAESLYLGASQQLRNMASLGGNILQKTRCPYFRDRAAYGQCNKRAPGSGCAAIGGDNRLQAVLGASRQCNATFHSDWAAALAALDTTVTVTGPGGTRDIPFLDVHVLPGETPEVETVLAPGDIITAITVRKTPLGRASTYLKVRDRASYQFANASAAVALTMDGPVVTDVRIGLGGVATIPWRAFAAEDALRGKLLTLDAALAAGRAAFAGASAQGNNAYKLELGVRTVAKAVLIAKERA